MRPRPSSAFVVEDPSTLTAFVDAHPFALLVGPGLHATQVPILRERTHEDGDTGVVRLVCHLAAGNAHAAALADATEVLAVFQGPHAYVSPRWYAPDPNGAVPTWNYTAVHVRARPVPMDDPLHLQASMDAMVAHFEPAMDGATDIREIVTARTVARMLTGIRGFILEVEQMHGIFKLSQNRSPADRARVHAALAAGDANQRAVAALMATGVGPAGASEPPA
ncbi:MAG TPA: FMN-binding negative transcriptional regulator [Pseudomonadales bacterium]|nr:FMN-binding negative transcriptional regulator [Pseudomonadales bacterium]